MASGKGRPSHKTLQKSGKGLNEAEASWQELLEKTQKVLRRKHYSYRTEKTYLLMGLSNTRHF